MGPLSSHGFARNTKFAVKELSEGHVVMQLTADDVSVEGFPSGWTLLMTVTVTDADGGTLKQTVRPLRSVQPLPLPRTSHARARSPLPPGSALSHAAAAAAATAQRCQQQWQPGLWSSRAAPQPPSGRPLLRLMSGLLLRPSPLLFGPWRCRLPGSIARVVACSSVPCLTCAPLDTGSI